MNNKRLIIRTLRGKMYFLIFHMFVVIELLVTTLTEHFTKDLRSLMVHQCLIISLVMVFAFRLRLKNSKRKYFKTQHRSVTCGLKQCPFTINQVLNPKTAIIYHSHEPFP